MQYEESKDAFHIPNPEYDISEFRLSSKGQGVINQVGTSNFGNGITARMGLLKGNGRTAPFQFDFSKEKWNLPDAQDWAGKFKGESFTEMDKIEEFDKEMWITGHVTKLDEEFDDERGIVAIDVPNNRDIPVRDLHSKGFEEVVGLTDADHIRFNKDGEMSVKWKVISGRLEKMVRSAKYPKQLFKYSPELSNPKYGKLGKRQISGLLSGIAITDNPSWSGSKNLEIQFEKLTEKEPEYELNNEAFEHAKELIEKGLYVEGNVPEDPSEFDKEMFSKYHLAYNVNAAEKDNSFCLPYGIDGKVYKGAIEQASKDAKQFENEALFEKINAINNLIKEDEKLAEKDTLQLQMKIKDLEIEKETFERDLGVSNNKIEEFEKEKETFEKKIEDLEGKVKETEEKFDKKVKDYDDLKQDHDEAVKTIEKFENEQKAQKVEEIFDLGVKVRRYEKDQKEDIVKELFEVSDERLDEKKENFEYMSKVLAKKGLPQTPNDEEGSSGRDAFTRLF